MSDRPITYATLSTGRRIVCHRGGLHGADTLGGWTPNTITEARDITERCYPGTKRPNHLNTATPPTAATSPDGPLQPARACSRLVQELADASMRDQSWQARMR